VGVPVGNGTPIAYTGSDQPGGWHLDAAGSVVDSSGRLLVAVGNGESGVGDPYDYSDSILAIDPTSAKLVDSFSPTTWPTDNDADLDLGSQGPTLVGSEWVFPRASPAPATSCGNRILADRRPGQPGADLQIVRRHRVEATSCTSRAQTGCARCASETTEP
jgi:hypothetical protein